MFSYPLAVRANKALSPRRFLNTSSTFSGVMIIQSTLSKSNSETFGNINSGLSIGSGVYVTVLGVDEQALRPIIRVSEIRTFVINL